MICALYKSSLVLAVLEKGYSYRILAVLPLAGGAVEEPDDGRGSISAPLLTSSADSMTQACNVSQHHTRGNLYLNPNTGSMK
jgi:hypothetical protein